jgi:hypothetical protein
MSNEFYLRSAEAPPNPLSEASAALWKMVPLARLVYGLADPHAASTAP